MKRISLGLVFAIAAFFLTGCFEVTDKSQLKQLVIATPLKNFSHLRLVNMTGKLPSELKEQMECPSLVRLSSNNEYQLYKCNGKPDDEKLKFYSVPDYPNLYIVKFLEKDCEAKEECLLITVKIQNDLAFAYMFYIGNDNFSEFLSLLESGLKDVNRLARLKALNGPKECNKGEKFCGGPIKVDSVKEMFFVANLISNDPPKSAQVWTFAIE